MAAGRAFPDMKPDATSFWRRPGSAARLALMLPKQAQKPILDLLRYYIRIRICIGAHYDPAKVSRDAARLVDRLADPWRGTMAISEPRSRFVTARAPANRPACPDSP